MDNTPGYGVTGRPMIVAYFQERPGAGGIRVNVSMEVRSMEIGMTQDRFASGPEMTIQARLPNMLVFDAPDMPGALAAMEQHWKNHERQRVQDSRYPRDTGIEVSRNLPPGTAYIRRGSSEARQRPAPAQQKPEAELSMLERLERASGSA